MNVSIWVKWALFLVSNAVLGASVMMMWKGTMPPPFNRKVSKLLSTSIFVVGMTLMLVFGTPELLQQTIELFSQG